MVKRIVLAGFLGGVVLFLWGAASHMLLGLGEVGMASLPNDDRLIPAMKESISAAGLYMFPAMPESQDAASQAAWTEKVRSGPWGILVYHPEGTEPLSPRQLGVELLSNIVAAWIAAYLLSRARALAGFGARVVFVGLLGLLAGVAIDVSYWNWYGFPGSYALAAIADQTIGFTLAGLPIAALVRPSPA
jgi:hypothetical protein